MSAEFPLRPAMPVIIRPIPLRRVPTAITDLHALYQGAAPSNVRPPTPWVDIVHPPTVTMHSPSPEPATVPPRPVHTTPGDRYFLDFSEERTRYVRDDPGPNRTAQA